MLRFSKVATQTATRGFATTATLYGSRTGTIVSYNRQKGFGFVEEGEGEKKITHFVHFSALNCEGGFKAVERGTVVEFDVTVDERNRDKTRAINVTAPGGKPLPTPPRPEGDNFRRDDRRGDNNRRGDDNNDDRRGGYENRRGDNDGRRGSYRGRGGSRGGDRGSGRNLDDF